MNHATVIKNTLMQIIEEHVARREEFVRNPTVDFTRNRKLSMEDTIKLILAMQGNSLTIELEKFFGHSEQTPTKSALVQQRQKLLPSLFESVFQEFNKRSEDPQLHKGYRLYAVDGTDLNVAYNPEADSYFPNTEIGCNLLHINALYNICNKTYMDIVVQPKRKSDEPGALVSMLKRNVFDDKSIVIVDRGYEGYNTIAHLLNTEGVDFVMRVKQRTSAMRYIQPLPMTTLDTYIEPCITTSQTNEDKRNNRVFLKTGSRKGKILSPKTALHRWDFPSPYQMRLRVVRFMINNKSDKHGRIEDNPDNYETIITSLSPREFSTNDIKELYHLRWGIETSFRELKYSMGLINLHAKNEDSVLQEVFAHFIMYNFCSRISMRVVVEQQETNEHVYQINFNVAIQLCRTYFTGELEDSPLIQRIRQYTEPIRPGRQDRRKLKPKTFVSFLYRVAA